MKVVTQRIRIVLDDLSISTVVDLKNEKNASMNLKYPDMRLYVRA